MPTKPDANTYEARKEKFELIRGKLGPSNPRSKNNSDRILTYIQSGALPFRSNYSAEDEHNRDRLHSNYFLQIFFSVGETIVEDNLSKSEAQSNLKEVKNASMPSGLPSDGSKGQWRTANKHKQKAYEWFLCKWDGDQF